MKLTEMQQQRISRYLRDVRARLAPLPEEERHGVVSSLATRIRKEIEQYGPQQPTDETIKKVLDTCGPPSEQAAGILGQSATGEGSFLAWNDRVWLGVCGGIAERYDIPPFAVRGVACVLGLILPLMPFVLAVYLGVFFINYAKVGPNSIPRLNVAGLVRGVGGAFAVALALFLGTKGLLWFIAYAHEQLLDRALVFASRWGWLQLENNSLFTWALFFTLPLATLAALPVPDAWQGTLHKVVQAVLALYALALCFGIASVIVGAILGAAGEFGGPAGIPVLSNLFRI